MIKYLIIGGALGIGLALAYCWLVEKSKKH